MPVQLMSPLRPYKDSTTHGAWSDVHELLLPKNSRCNEKLKITILDDESTLSYKPMLIDMGPQIKTIRPGNTRRRQTTL